MRLGAENRNCAFMAPNQTSVFLVTSINLLNRSNYRAAALLSLIDLRDIFLRLLIELRLAILAAELNRLPLVNECVGLVSKILSGHNTLGQRV